MFSRGQKVGVLPIFCIGSADVRPMQFTLREERGGVQVGACP